jgi:hypothetical protein
MYYSKILNLIKLDYFLKFIVHELNYEMVKSEMMMLTDKEKIDVADTDVIIDWKLQHVVKPVVDEREKKLIWCRAPGTSLSNDI